MPILSLTFRLAALAFLAASFSAAPAAAVDRCKVKVNKKNGDLVVSASNIQGTLTWGFTADAALGFFENDGECVSNGRAKNCVLGAEGTPERITPPPLCKLHLEDDSQETCAAYVPGCVPGARPICAPGMTRVGGWCMDEVSPGVATRNGAVVACDARGLSLCPVEAMMTCDSVRTPAMGASTCGALTDQTLIWTEGTYAGSNQAIFSRLSCYNGSNNTIGFGGSCQSGGSFYPYFCCHAAAGQ